MLMPTEGKMRKLLRRFWTGLAILLVAFVVFWLWAMPRANMRGVWLTQGYGFAINITPFTVDIREVSPISCERYQIAPANLWLIKNFGGLTFERNDERLVIHSEDTLNPINAVRIDAMPDICTSPTPDSNDPEYIYDVFWTAFDEHYSFFDLHGINWDQVRADIRPSITADTTEDELYIALKSSISGLDDGHTYVHRITEGYSGAVAHPWNEHWDTFEIIGDNFADNGMVQIENTGVKYGFIDGHIGLIRITHMETNPPLGTSLTEMAQQAAAELIDAMKDTDQIIIDIRFNGGGDDTTSLGYAGAFTPERLLAFTKSTRMGDTYTDPFEGYVEPSIYGHLDQPITLLTSGMVASAAEIFTMAMREMPQVTIIGEPTAGFFSDIHSRNLPNGWGFGMSHQIYKSASGEVFEGQGVPPSTLREMDGEAFLEGRDTLMIEVLSGL